MKLLDLLVLQAVSVASGSLSLSFREPGQASPCAASNPVIAIFDYAINSRLSRPRM
jgi:hypothetical protein